MWVDFVQNGRGHGEVGEALQGVRFDPNLMRPYKDENGRPCVTMNTGRTTRDPAKMTKNQKRAFKKTGQAQVVYEKAFIKDVRDAGIDSPVFNATSLRKEEWIKVDQVVLKTARARLRAWSDLAAASSYGGFDGMSVTMLEQETMSDPGEAVVDMDGLTEGRNDAPKFQLEGLPLPITHSDFWFSKRVLATSQNRGTPLNLTMAEAAGRRVAEMVEKTLIGVETGLTYGGGSSTPTYSRASKVNGYINYSARLTKTNLTVPTGSNPEATVADVLAMRDQLSAVNKFGPFMLYHSNDWDQYLDNDYARLGGSNANMTLRDRLRRIEGIQDVKRLDFLTAANSHAFTMIMVSMDGETAQAVNGLDLTTMQWESQGGMRLNFKVMCIYVPRLMADQSGACGILHARTA